MDGSCVVRLCHLLVQLSIISNWKLDLSTDPGYKKFLLPQRLSGSSRANSHQKRGQWVGQPAQVCLNRTKCFTGSSSFRHSNNKNFI